MQEQIKLKMEYTTHLASVYRLPEAILNAALDVIGSTDFRLMTAFEQRVLGLVSLGIDTAALRCNDAV